MKKFNFFTFVVILFATFNSIAQTFDEKALEERTSPFGEADNPDITWKIRWDRSDLFKNDDFPDPDFKYNTRIWTKSPENVQSWVWRNKQNIEQRDGSLFITARYEESGFPENMVPSGCVNGSPSSNLVPVRFSSGMLRSTTPDFVYGYYEAAVKGSAGFPGVSPSFWLYNNIKSNSNVGQVRYQEIDIVELTQEGTTESTRKVMDHNLHAITSASSRHEFDSSLNLPVGAFIPQVGQNGQLTVGPLPSTAGRRWWRPKQNTAAARNETNEFEPRDINIFGCLVTAQEIVWYVNGKEIGRKPNVLWQNDSGLDPMRITFSLGIRAPFNKFCSNRFVMPDPSVLETARDFFPQTMQVLYVKVFEPLSDSSEKISVNNVVLKQSEVPLRVGGNTIITPVIAPKEATNKNFEFFSVSDMDVARIDSKTGIVTALKIGSATFRVITEDGNFFDDITVTVNENPQQTRNATIPVPPGSAGLVTDPSNPDNSNCNNISVWKKSNIFSIGDKVQLDGKLYELKSSSGRCRPGGNSRCSINQWKEIGSCGRQNLESLLSIENEIEVYPNPTVNMVNISSRKGSKISIINPNGKVVASKLGKGEITSFDTKDLSKGLYLVKIKIKSKVITKKLIIN